MQLDGFVPGRMAADKFHLAARAIEYFRQQPDEGVIGRCIHGWGGDFDAQFVAKRADYFIFGCARLEFDGQQYSVGLGGKKSGMGLVTH